MTAGPPTGPQTGHVALCVLAGGAGRRLGGRDKAMLDVGDGRPLLSRVLHRLAPWPGPVMVSVHATTDRARLAAVLTANRVDTLVTDAPLEADDARAGPLAGLLAGLEAAARDPAVRWLVTVPTDLPFVSPDLLGRLWRARVTAAAPGACAVSGGRRQSLVALWPVSRAGDLRTAMRTEGVRRVGDWAARCDLAEARWPDPTPDPFLNINDPESLAAARALVSATAGARAPPPQGFPLIGGGGRP